MTTPKLDEQKALTWLNQHWVGSKSCAVCTNTKWAISDNIMEVRPFLGGSLMVGGSIIYPLILVTCDTCGHALFFNAKMLGLLEGQE